MIFTLPHRAREFQVGLSMRDPIPSRSLVVTLNAYRERTRVPIVGGTRWSDSLKENYCYVESDSRGWMSNPIRLESAAEQLTIEFIAWPSRKPYDQSGMTKIALLVDLGENMTHSIIRSFSEDLDA